MKPVFFLLVLTLIACSRPAKNIDRPQTDSLGAGSYEKLFAPSFDWHSLEGKMSYAERRKWLEEHMPWRLAGDRDSAYVASVYAFDFNGDGRDDYFYSGSGPVTYWSSINITGDSASYYTDGLLVDMDIRQGKVSRLYFHKVLATGGPSIEGYAVVDVRYQGTKINFVPRVGCEQIGRLRPPAGFTSFEVESISDTIITRLEPIEMDSPFDYILELPGNQLGKILKGTRAVVAGTEKDSLNQLWYFLLVEPQSDIKGYFHSDSTLSPILWTRSEGWKKR